MKLYWWTFLLVASLSSQESFAALVYLTGKIFLATNHLLEARKSLASASAQRPDEENYALDLALHYIRSGTCAQVAKLFRPALATHPGSEELALELALTDVLAAHYAEGLSICKKLQQQDPALSLPRLISAFSYCSQRDYKACEDESSAGLASPHLKKAAEGDAQPASAWYRLSMPYRKTGQPAEASEAPRHYKSLHDEGLNQEIESFQRQFLEGISSKNTQ